VRRSPTWGVEGTRSVDPDSALEFACELDGGNVRPCTSPKVYRDLGKGRHKVRVRARDTAGNLSEFDKKGFKIEK
jgi:hypothetical protein